MSVRRVELRSIRPLGKRDRGPLEMVDKSNDYYVVTSRRREQVERWSWEIRRNSKPLGIRFSADGFPSEGAAQFAGKKACRRFSDRTIERRTALPKVDWGVAPNPEANLLRQPPPETTAKPELRYRLTRRHGSAPASPPANAVYSDRKAACAS